MTTDSATLYTPTPAAPSWRFLYGINPLAKLAAPILPVIALLFVRDIETPVAVLVFTYALLLVGAQLTTSLAIILFVAFPLIIALTGFGLTLWLDPSQVGGQPVFQWGSWVITSGAIAEGYATALRMGAMIGVALIAGVTTAGPDLVRSAVQHLHLPYRVGYAALAAYRFVPRFRHELDVIRSAHRVRGRHGGRGPIAAIRRGWGYILPLMAGAIRHAERVALAMDSRAFGAYETRTERYLVPWRARDTWFLVGFTAVVIAIFALCYPWV